MNQGTGDNNHLTTRSNTGFRTFIAFDYGKKRIGVATGQEQTCTASALTTLQSINNQPDWKKIGELIETWKPDALVLGVPYHMDGAEHDMTQNAQHFGRQLHGRFNLPVIEVDERLTSYEAYDEIVQQRKSGLRKKTRKQDIDMLAAQIILQDWLDHISRQQEDLS